MKKEDKKKSKKETICKALVSLVVVAGVSYLAYKKFPAIKNFVSNKILTEDKPTREFKTRPFRKYENYQKK